MSYTFDEKTRHDFFEYLLRLGDERLIHGHRLSEWCGHAPILEEDIALANIALDLIGQSSALLTLAAEIANKNRTEDDLAFFRTDVEFRNANLVELPNNDFAYTTIKLFFHSAFSLYYLDELSKVSFETLAGRAAKSLKEVKYHYRHSKDWVLKLGDGTQESKNKIQNALNDYWMYLDELFYTDEIEESLSEINLAVKPNKLKEKVLSEILKVLEEAALVIPDDKNQYLSIGRIGHHTEHLGHLLSELQIVARSHPGAKW